MLSVTSPHKSPRRMMSTQPCADRSASARIPASECEFLKKKWEMFQKLLTTATPTMRLLQLKRLGRAATSTWAQ